MFATRTLLLSVILSKAAFLMSQQPAPLTDEEKRRQFLKAREEMRTIPSTPRPDATPRPRPKPARPVSTPAARTTPEPPAPTPSPGRPTPERVVTTPARPSTPTTEMRRPPVITPATTPLPSQAPEAPVTIEKSGFEEDRGVHPAPPSTWWTRWKYLTKGVRDEIDKARVQRRRWRYIVVHNSGTRQGNAKAFEYYHLRVRKMPNGLAYHFVIGNGSSSGDGQIEIGNRWRRQINGGHVHSDYLNNIAIGICLVGDYNRGQPTKRQTEALEELIRYLRQRVGKIDRQWAIVKAHREINPPRWPTDCPGDQFPYRWLHGKFD